MIYLLPFLNAFLLYICIEPKQLLHNVYTWFMENMAVYFPAWVIKILGGCILCTAAWMGITELSIWLLVEHHFFSFFILKDYVLIFAYNAVTTSIIYKFLQ